MKLGHAVLRVTNSGPVGAPEHVGRMTSPFVRLGRHGDAPGAGLGLSIVQAVADSHGASLLIEAPPEGGLDVMVRF